MALIFATQKEVHVNYQSPLPDKKKKKKKKKRKPNIFKLEVLGKTKTKYMYLVFVFFCRVMVIYNYVVLESYLKINYRFSYETRAARLPEILETINVLKGD